MALFDPARRPDIAPEDAVVVVHDFLRRARAWATEREIPKRVQRVSAGGSHTEAAKLAAWVAWRDFVDHALGELEDGRLDHWFGPDEPQG